MKEAHSRNQLIKKWHFTRAAVPFKIPLFEKSWWWASEFLGVEKLTSFSLIHRKQKLTRIVTLICWRLPYCLNVVDIIRAMTEFLQDTVPPHRAKVTQQFLWQNTPDYIAADEWASYSPDLNLMDYCIWDILQDLGYEGWRLTSASLQDLKEAINYKWKEVTIETVRKSIAQWKNDWMRLESRMVVRFSTFSLITVTG